MGQSLIELIYYLWGMCVARCGSQACRQESKIFNIELQTKLCCCGFIMFCGRVSSPCAVLCVDCMRRKTESKQASQERVERNVEEKCGEWLSPCRGRGVRSHLTELGQDDHDVVE